MKKLLLSILVITCSCNVSLRAQSLVFATLQGQPTINTAGWNLTGAAIAGDTPGDADSNPNELILTPPSNQSSGGIFYDQVIDLGTCTKWTVDFDFRIFNGNGADGIAFCFLDVPPTGFVAGGGVGIPSSANGLKVVFDTYDNGCGANPEIQIVSGIGYGECAPGIAKVNNSGGSLNFIRSNNYNTARITYDNGLVSVTVNNTLYLTGTFPISFPGYMGFTASTGGANDQHSVKNVTIYADIALSDAGADRNLCTGSTTQIGVADNPNYTYTWTPAANLSATNISNPTVTIVNSGTTPIVQEYIVETYLSANLGACPTTDTVKVTVNPIFTGSVNATICQGANYLFGGQNYAVAGSYPVVFQSVNLCDSTVTLNLTVNPTYNLVQNATICQGGTYAFGGQNYNAAGSFPVTFQTVSGCDSVVTLNLTVNAAYTNVNNQTICAGESYTLNGTNYSTAGTFVINLQSATGCDSIVTLNLTVKPIFNTTRNETICEGESIAFGGQNFSASGTYPISFQAVNGCDSLATLILNVNPTYINTVSASICAGASYTFGGQSYNTSGTYPMTYQSVNGCDSIQILNLVVNAIPAMPVVVSNSPVLCPGELFLMSINPPANATIAWSGPNGFAASTAVVTFESTEMNTGNYNVSITVNGCTSPPATALLDIVGTDLILNFDFPNVITANADKINDSLDVDQFFNPCVSYDLMVWNRWGNIVYKQKFGSEPFSGKDQNGNVLSDGVYFYTLKFGEIERKGNITIVH